MERLLTYRQAAERLGCSLRTIKRRVKAGEIPVHRLSRKDVRISERDLAVYLAERRTIGGEAA